MVGRETFPFGFRPIFLKYLLKVLLPKDLVVCFSRFQSFVSNLKNNVRVGDLRSDRNFPILKVLGSFRLMVPDLMVTIHGFSYWGVLSKNEETWRS